MSEARALRDKQFSDASKAFVAGIAADDELYDAEGRKVKSPVDKEAIGKQVDDAYLAGQVSWDQTLRGAIGIQVRTVLEETGITLSPEKREELKELGNSPGQDSMGWLRSYIHATVDAAKAAAPDEIRQKARSEVEKELKATERLAEVAGLLKGKRKKQLAPSGAASTSWSTKMEARALHVQNKITNAEMKRINADPSVPEM
jgi:hypothetical protein